MPELSIVIERPSAKLTLARLKGDFEGQLLQDRKEELLSCAALGGDYMLDFSEVGYIDSSGIGVLLELAKAAAGTGTRFGLLNVPEPVMKVLTVTRVDKVLKIYGSV